MFGQVRQTTSILRFGQVVDIEDPNRAGRARVRIYGEHDDTAAIPDDMLPWATPIMPVTSPSFAGAGSTAAFEKGSRVICCIMDYPDNQHIVILGTHYVSTGQNGETSGNHYPPRAVAEQDNGPKPPQGQSAPPGGLVGNVGVDEQPRSKFTSMIEKFSKFLIG